MAQLELHFPKAPDTLQPFSSAPVSQSINTIPISQPLSVRIKEACRLTGIGRSKLYELIAAGEIEVIKVGTITLIPMEALRRFLDVRRAR